MREDNRDKGELLAEIANLRKRVEELEQSISRVSATVKAADLEKEQLLSIFDSIDEIIYVSDPTSHEILFCNRALKERFGKDPTGGICYREFQGREEPCPFCTNPVLLADPGRAHYWEYHNPVLDRDYLLVDRLIRWPDGRRARFELAVDVTERKRVERALRERESELAGIFRAAPVGIGVVSYPDRVIMRVNGKLCEMLGYREEELLGKSARIIYPDEEEYRRVGEVKYLDITEKGVGTIETKWKRKDGRIIDVILSSTFLDSQDPSSGTVFTALDITESKRSREYREKIGRVMLGLGTDAMENIYSLLEGTREILACSHAALYLMTKGRLVLLTTLPGEDRFMVLPGKDAENVLCPVVALRGSGYAAFSDLSRVPEAQRDPLLSRFALRSCLLVPVPAEGEAVGHLAAFVWEPRAWGGEDVEAMMTTARVISVELERLRHEDELKDFVDVASHEMRHPITVIKGYVSSLREHWRVLDDERREELMRAVERGTDRLTRLVSELLDISRIERGRFTLNKRPTEVRDVVAEAVEEMRRLGFDNPIELHLPGRETVLEADPDRLLEVLLILLENAVSFSPPHANVEVEVREESTALLISVRDRGVGIPQEEREKVFQRFYQVEDALHHSAPGMGMGLYIAREIVERHGGIIWNEPREGGGTAFHVTLPLAPAREVEGGDREDKLGEDGG